MVSDLWVDIFQPKHLNEIIGQEELVKSFQMYVKDRHIPNMTISGAPGIGKTLLMQCFGTDLGLVKFEGKNQIDLIPGQFYIFNASQSRGIDDVRTTMKRLSSKPTIDGMPRLIVLDEFNYTDDAQAAMRSLMETYSSNVRFIILSNDPSNIIDPIISRCPLKIAQSHTLENIKILVQKIQKEKAFKITLEATELLFKITQGDIRAFISQLQNACLISNFNVDIQHIQTTSVDVMTAKSILEAAQINYDSAREVMITVFTKTGLIRPLLTKLYEATYITKFSDDAESNKIIAMRLREKIANMDFGWTPGTNALLQLDSLINYVRLLKFIPLTCPKSK